MKYSLYLLLLSFLISCVQRDDSAVPNEYAARFIRDLNTSDTFRFEFPFKFSRRLGKIDSTSFFQRREFISKTDLQNLEQGVDSVCIRMFYSWALLSEFVMLELKISAGKWIAEVSRFKSYYNTVKELNDSFSRQIVRDFPKSGWVNLITQLFELKILTLDDEMIIPIRMLASVADGDGIDFEIATRNTFRAYGYGNPADQPDEIWQVRNVKKIKEVLWNEFSELNKSDAQILEDFHDRNNRRSNEPGHIIKESGIKLNEIKVNDTMFLKDINSH